MITHGRGYLFGIEDDEEESLEGDFLLAADDGEDYDTK